MKYLETLLTKLQNFLFPSKTETGEEIFLCLFLKYGTDFMFLSKEKEDNYEAGKYKPLVIPLNSLGKIENNFYLISEFMMEEFDVTPDKIQIATEFVSLAPIKNQIYYFAIIDITKEDVIELKKRESFGHFSNLPFPYISIKAERNFFFQIILKLVADQPYIICNDLKKENIQNPNLRKNQS